LENIRSVQSPANIDREAVHRRFEETIDPPARHLRGRCDAGTDALVARNAGSRLLRRIGGGTRDVVVRGGRGERDDERDVDGCRLSTVERVRKAISGRGVRLPARPDAALDIAMDCVCQRRQSW